MWVVDIFDPPPTESQNIAEDCSPSPPSQPAGSFERG